MKETITSYVGLDVHKDSIAIALAEAGRSAPRRRSRRCSAKPSRAAPNEVTLWLCTRQALRLWLGTISELARMALRGDLARAHHAQSFGEAA